MRITWVLPLLHHTMLAAVQRGTRGLRSLGLDATYAGEREAGASQVHEWIDAASGTVVLRLVNDPGFGFAYLEIDAAQGGKAAEVLRVALGSDAPLDGQQLLQRAQAAPDDASALAAAALAWRDVDPARARAPIEQALRTLPSDAWQGALMAALLLADPGLRPALEQARNALPEGPERDAFEWLIASLGPAR